MRRFVILAVAAVAIAGGLYYGLVVNPNQQFRQWLDQTIAKLPAGYSVKYGKARYSLLNHTAKISDLSVQFASETTPIDASIAEIAVTRPNFDFEEAWDHAAANPGALPPDQALPVAGAITLHGVKFHGSSFEVSLDTSSLIKLRLYPWALLHGGLPALADLPEIFGGAIGAQQKAVAEQQHQTQPQTPEQLKAMQREQLQQFLPMMRVESALLLGLGYDAYDVDTMSIKVTQPASDALPAISLSVLTQKIRNGSFDRGIGGDFVIDGVTEDMGPMMKVSVGHLVESKLAFRDPAMRLLNGDPVSLTMLNGLSMGRFELDQMTMTTPTGEPVAVQSMFVSDLAFDHDFLASGAFGMTGLKQKVSALQDPRAEVTLQQMGLETITLSMGASFLWDADKKTASFNDVSLKVDELGALKVDAVLANIVRDGPEPFAEATLAGGTIRYDDASLIDRLVSAGGTRTPAQVEQIRRQFAAGLVQNIATTQSDPKLLASAKAVSDFAAAPHSLVITIAPPKPIPVASLQTIGVAGLPGLIGALGLSVTANQ